MRRLVALAGLVMVMAPAGAQAGDVCVNGGCNGVPGIHARVTAGLTGTVKVDGGLDGGPGLAPTGMQSMVVKLDNVALYPVVNGHQMGRYGYAFGSGILWLYLGPHGCRQTSEDETLVPCHPPNEDP